MNLVAIFMLITFFTHTGELACLDVFVRNEELL